MKHANQARLALHAGNDLGPWARWRTRRHLAKCSECRGELAAFEAARGGLAEFPALPEVPWKRLATQMKANIRLGLTLGELEAETGGKARGLVRPFGWTRPAAAFAGVAALIVAGLALEQGGTRAARGYQGAEVETTAEGIEVSEGGGALGMLHGAKDDVNYTPGAQGSMAAQEVDESGHVTVTNVYAN